MSWELFIVPIGMIVVCLYSFQMIKKNKKYYSEHSEDRIKEEQKALEQVKRIVKGIHPEWVEQVLLNGHYITTAQLGVKVTTYYSYLLVLDKERSVIHLLSYDPKTEEATDLGTYERKEIEAVSLGKGGQTNYLFTRKDRGKKIRVQTKAVTVNGYTANQYQIEYPQEAAYNEFRKFFNLPLFFISDSLKSERRKNMFLSYVLAVFTISYIGSSIYRLKKAKGTGNSVQIRPLYFIASLLVLLIACYSIIRQQPYDEIISIINSKI